MAVSASNITESSFEWRASTKSGMAARPRRMPIARAALARASVPEPVRDQFAERGDDFRSNFNISVDHLIVGIGELCLDRGSDALQSAAEAGFEIARQVNVHQAVGRANFDFRIGVGAKLDQGIDRFRARRFR